MRNRRASLVVLAVVLLALAVRHPSANISILTHESSDRAPHRFQAAVDMGLVAVSVLVTWTNKRLT